MPFSFDIEYNERDFCHKDRLVLYTSFPIIKSGTDKASRRICKYINSVSKIIEKKCTCTLFEAAKRNFDKKREEGKAYTFSPITLKEKAVFEEKDGALYITVTVSVTHGARDVKKITCLYRFNNKGRLVKSKFVAYSDNRVNGK